GVFGQLVHACHTRAMSAVVVEDCFNVVGLHAQFAELGCACSAEVVDAPGCDTKALVKLLLGTPPVAITAALAEQIVGGVTSRQSLQDRYGLRRERHFMLATILDARWWKHDHLTGEVDLAPSQRTNLVPALAGEQEQAHAHLVLLRVIVCARHSLHFSLGA